MNEAGVFFGLMLLHGAADAYIKAYAVCIQTYLDVPNG